MRLISTTVAIFIALFYHYPVASQQVETPNPTVYINEELGVKAVFDDEWLIITSREEAPEMMKPNFPENKGKNEWHLVKQKILI